jgi:hypothetical protein
MIPLFKGDEGEERHGSMGGGARGRMGRSCIYESKYLGIEVARYLGI